MGVFWREKSQPEQVAPETRIADEPSVVRAMTAPARTSSMSVSVDEALSLSAVYRSIQIIVTSVSQMDLAVYRNNRQLDLPSIIKQPNAFDTRSAFIEETVFSLAAHGNAFWLLHRSAGAGTAVVSMEILDPTTVTIRRDANGKRTYWFSDTEHSYELPEWRVKHLKLLRRPGQMFGMGPIQAAAKELRGAIRLREFVDAWFDVSGVPTGILTTDQILNASQTTEYRDRWNSFINSDEGRTAVLGQGMRYEPLMLKPADAQLLEVQSAMVQNIARLFGIPATYLITNAGDSMTYKNQQDLKIDYLLTTLARYMNEIEVAFTGLLPRGQEVRFNEEQLLRLDTKSVWEVNKKKVEIGFTNGDELRAEAGKAPLPTTANDDPSATTTEASNGDSRVPRSGD